MCSCEKCSELKAQPCTKQPNRTVQYSALRSGRATRTPTLMPMDRPLMSFDVRVK